MLMGTGKIHLDVSAIKLLNRKKLKYKIMRSGNRELYFSVSNSA